MLCFLYNPTPPLNILPYFSVLECIVVSRGRYMSIHSEPPVTEHAVVFVGAHDSKGFVLIID